MVNVVEKLRKPPNLVPAVPSVTTTPTKTPPNVNDISFSVNSGLSQIKVKKRKLSSDLGVSGMASSTVIKVTEFSDVTNSPKAQRALEFDWKRDWQSMQKNDLVEVRRQNECSSYRRYR